MKNYIGQEIAVGSTVGVGFRRTGSTWHQLGVVVKFEEKSPDFCKPYWAATVVWVSEERGREHWYDGPVFTSQFPASDLLVIDDASIDRSLLQALEGAYADWVFKHAPVPFIPPAQ